MAKLANYGQSPEYSTMAIEAQQLIRHVAVFQIVLVEEIKADEERQINGYNVNNDGYMATRCG